MAVASILERELEDVIFDGLSSLEGRIELLKRGLNFSDHRYKYYRQVNLGKYGIADIVGVSFDPVGRVLDVLVIELKKDDVNIKTLTQAVRYSAGIKNYVDNISFTISVRPRIVLIGSNIDTSDEFCFYSVAFRDISLYEYSIDLFGGLRFTEKDAFSYRENNYDGFNKDVISDVYSDILKSYRNYIRRYHDTFI